MALPRSLKHILLIAVILVVAVDLSSACHRRRKRSTYFLTVEEFFPSCMKTRLEDSGDYGLRDWAGAVDFAVYHSQWYADSNSLYCAIDRAECWIERMNSFISPDSPALEAAKKCVADYSNLMLGRKTVFADPPSKFRPERSQTCQKVARANFTSDIRALVNSRDLVAADRTLSFLDDVAVFVETDMICPTCGCEEISPDEDGTTGYELPSGESCNRCWVTRFAGAIRRGSSFRRPAAKVAVRRGGLTKRPRTKPSKYKKNPFKIPPRRRPMFYRLS